MPLDIIVSSTNVVKKMTDFLEYVEWDLNKTAVTAICQEVSAEPAIVSNTWEVLGNAKFWAPPQVY